MASTRFSLRLDVGVLGGDVPKDLEEQPVRVLHDVRLRHAVDGAPALCACVVEREANDPLRGFRAHGLDREAGLRVQLLRLQPAERRDQLLRRLASRFELDAGIEVFGVLADDDHVDGLVSGAHAGIGLARPQAGVEVQLVAERDVHGAEPRADRRRDRALEGHARVADGGQRLLRQRVAVVRLHDVCARLLHVPVELDAGRLEHAAGRLGQLGARAVAGDEGYAVRHPAEDSNQGVRH